jgi:hypothetical protein
MRNNDVPHHTIPSRLVWGVVGSEVVICDTTSHTTFHLTGDLAKAFTQAASGQEISSQEVMALQERGFLEPRSPLSRRTLMTGGVAGLGLGITSLSLPTAAAASSTQPKPSITAASLEPGEWRWSPTGGGFSVTQTQGSVFLPNLDVFQAGDRWRLTLANVNGGEASAEANITDLGMGMLELTFTFTLSGGLPANTVLLGVLTKVSDPTVFSEQFPIPQAQSE